MKQTLRRFLPYFKDYKLQFFFVVIGILAAAGGTVGTAQVIKPILDNIFIEKNEDMLYTIPFLIVAVYTTKGLGRYIQAYFTAYIGQDIIRRLRDQMLERILHLDMKFHHTYRSGELISRITNDIGKVQNVVSNMIPELVRETLTIVGLVGYVIYMSPELAFYSLVVLPLAFYPVTRLAKRMKKISHRSQEKNSDLTSRLTEIFYNTEIIKANATESLETKKFGVENKEFFKLLMKGMKVSEVISPIMETLGSIGIALVIIVGGKQVIDGEMTVGSFFAFLTALGMLYDPIRRITRLYNNLQEAIAAGERIFFILDLEPEIKDGANILKKNVSQIQVNNISMRYDEDHIALKNVSLQAKKGELIALVGDSGGGKSSLVNLLTRFYDPYEGNITFNQTNIKEFSLESLRKQVAIVTQRVYIFQDTLAANVAYGMQYSEEKVIEALKKADAWDFVEKLDEGIHTMLDEFGNNLSGGQRQRIALARAVYKDASILILDEATAALDNKSEKRIQDALKNIMKDKITFSIAHRLSTIQDADNILVFKAGSIVDAGCHEYLLTHSKEYQKLSGQQELN